MNLKESVVEDMKQYQRNKDVYALEAIRMLRSDIKNLEIAKKAVLTDDEVIKLIHSTVKKNKEASDIYRKAGRCDIADKEDRYTEVLSKYLPKQMAVEEIVAIARDILQSTPAGGSKDPFSSVMKAVLAKVGGNADGKSVSLAVKQVLAEKGNK